MAIPDPHIDEMRLLCYEPRPRLCKQTFLVPRRQDYIEVMWCLDHLPDLPERWCTAEVLHVTPCAEQGVIANGVIRYLPDDSWDEEIHQVQFLQDHKIRRMDEDTDKEGNCGSSTNAPVTKWQFASPGGKRSASSEDEEWVIEKKIKRSRLEILPHDDAVHDEAQQTEIDSLRSGYASLAVEIEKIKREVSQHSLSLRSIQRYGTELEACQSAGCVLQRLRHRIGMKMQIGLRSMNSAVDDESSEMRTGDGIQIGIVKAKVECTLLQFEGIARRVKASANPKSILFVPEFHHTQLPLPYSAVFRILFNTFLELSSQIGIKSLGDVLEMVRKCGTNKSEDILRILGTYDFDKDNSSASANIYLGASCGQRAEPTAEGPPCSPLKDPFPILTRQSREWDRVDRRFSSPLRLEHRQIPALEASTSEAQAFSLVWKRATDLGP